MTLSPPDVTSTSQLHNARSAIAQTQRRRLTSVMQELANLDGELLLQAAGYLEQYDRDRLAVLLTLSADQR